MTEDFVRYLEMCVNFHHENDESFKITDSAYEKENLMYLKAIHYINELYNDVEGNHTIEQNAGENRIEGGVVGISGSAANQYRPFKDCKELIEHYQKKYESAVGCDIYFPSLYKPNIWVKSKEYGTDNLITAFDNDNESIGGSCVFIQDIWVDMKELFDNFIFLDGSPCGLEGLDK
jgi:hypothetical protein